MINGKIFKTYDVRGVYPEEFNEISAYLISQSFIIWLKKNGLRNPVIAVGYDMRSSSINIFKAIIRAFKDERLKFYPLGLVPTPLVGFFMSQNQCDAGIVISASHNPKKYNALKLLKKEVSGILQIGMGFGLENIKDIALNLASGSYDFNQLTNQLTANVDEVNDLNKKNYNDYLLYLARNFSFDKNFINSLKIAADYGNGMGGLLMPLILKKYGIKTFNFFKKPDGNFPNHDPNPHEEKNFDFLKTRVKKLKCDLGLFFDGDCDRVFFVDEFGEIIEADLILIMLANFELKKNPKEKTIYYDLRSSHILKETLAPKGIRCIRTPTGNPLIKKKMIFEGGFLGGEMSGHIMFKEHFCLDDGFYTALKVLEIMNKERKPLSELIRAYKKYFKIHEINIPVAKDPKKILMDLDQKFKAIYQEANFDYLDGITVEFNDWWFNIRASNTENLLRFNLEANKKELMIEKAREIQDLIKTT